MTDADLLAGLSPRRRTLLLGSLAACALPFGVHAADYPERAVRLVVPWPAGGVTDLAGRAFAVQLGKQMNGNVVVENRPGATGIVGTTSVANSQADGYTILLATAETHAINPYTFEKLPYNPADFIPIAAFATNPYALVTRPDFPAQKTRELVETVRKQPGKLNYSSAGLGSASQIVMEMFKGDAGLHVVHVPYQGEAPAVAALLGGQTDMMILPLGRAAALRESGKIKVYAVTPANRHPSMPDVPTMGEEGYAGLQIANWFSLMVPVGTPEPVVRRLAEATSAAARDDETIKAMAKLGLGTFPAMTQAQFAAFIAKERERWRATVERAKIRAPQQ